ncbi:putative membrane protein [Neochlamydia sp. EPS4]|nr:putative membrane protein [Neochlamydia sp. EPS4]
MFGENMRSFTLTMQYFIGEGKKRNPLLFYLAILNFALAIFLLSLIPLGSPVASETIPWIKPIKFAFSFGLYLLTIGWILVYLKISTKMFLAISRLTALLIFMEMLVIVLQSIQGKIYHFSIEQPLTLAICYGMCLYLFSHLLIVANTLITSYILYLFFQPTTLCSPAYLWGIRLGLVIFLLSCLEGGFIAFQDMYLRQGQVLSGWGLPFADYTSRGYLTSSHFFGLHALQALPVIGYTLRNRLHSQQLIFSIGIIYFTIFGYLFGKAIN